MYPRNAASPEPIAIGPVILIADGTVQTSGVTVRIKPIGVAEADGGGTTAYSTDGIILYTPTQAETNYTSFVLIAKKASCIPASITVITTASATPGTVRMQSAADNAITFQSINDGAIGLNKIGSNAITSSTIQAATFTANKFENSWLVAAGVAAGALNGKGDWNVGKTGYALAATTGLGNQTANITGNLTGSVGSVTGAVGSVTGAVGSVTGNVGGNVVGSVGSVTGGATATALADVATEVGKIPRAALALAAGSFTVEVVNGQVIAGGQSVDMEYK